MLFKTQVGPTGKETAYLRPETCQSLFVDFYDLYKTQGMKLPALLAQAGRSYRNEISPRQHLIRLRELNQLELEVFFKPEEEQKEMGIYDIDEILKEKISFISGDS